MDKPKLKEFGLIMAAALILLDLFLFWRKDEISVPIIFFSALFFILSFVGTNALEPLYKIWMALSSMMGKCVSALILIVLFYLVIAPTGLIMKLLNKDLLGLKFNRDKNSYWLKKEQSSKSSYEKQF